MRKTAIAHRPGSVAKDTRLPRSFSKKKTAMPMQRNCCRRRKMTSTSSTSISMVRGINCLGFSDQLDGRQKPEPVTVDPEAADVAAGHRRDERTAAELFAGVDVREVHLDRRH